MRLIGTFGRTILNYKKEFLNICMNLIKEVTNFETNVSTNGGTSDGRLWQKL